MSTRVTEIASGVFRLSTFHEGAGIQFNQFLVADDEPFLIHTGMRRMFAATLDGVARVIDPATLRWIGYSHFEPDECGALNEWLRVAPRAVPVCNFVGNAVMLEDYSDRPARVLADDETLAIGSRRVRFLSTPHVPHGWDAGMFFEETERTLFSSDLFFHPGDPPPVVASDVVGPAEAAVVEGKAGPLANDVPYTAHTDAVLRRLAALEPRTLAVMHGSSFEGDGRRALLDLAVVLARELG